MMLLKIIVRKFPGTSKLYRFRSKIMIANSEGLLTEDRRVRTRLSIRSIASNGVENQTGSEGPGAMGFEMFEVLDPEYYGVEASKSAVTMPTLETVLQAG